MIKERIARLRQFLIEQAADGAVIMQPENLRYFSGFTGGEGALVLMTEGKPVLWTDSRYTEQAAQQSGIECDIKNHEGRLLECIGCFIKENSMHVVGYEKNYLTLAAYEGITTHADESRFVGCAFSFLRAVKTVSELQSTREASIIADKAFNQLMPYIKPGVTECELCARLESSMLLLGSEEKSFTTIVASGARSAMPHGTASQKVVADGDFVTFDFGAVIDGYHSDMTRTVVAGRASQEQKEFYGLVLEAQQLGVSIIRAGLSCREADETIRQFFIDHAVGTYFTHALGHGTGLEIHEQPVLSPKAETILQENMIVTVEPGLYIEGKYGVRIEDSVVVTAHGCEILTKTPKELVELS